MAAMSPLVRTIFLVSLSLTPSSAYGTIQPSLISATRANFLQQNASFGSRSSSRLSALFAENEASSSTGARRRKRKVPLGDPQSAALESEVPQATDQLPIKRPKDAPVTFKVQNVNELMVGSESNDESDEPTSPSAFSPRSFLSNPFQKSSSPAPSTRQSASLSSTGSADNDSLKQLLIDAQQMQSSESSDSASQDVNPIRSILSTIVTVDFFVVCGFLLWFLAGIFCSSVLKDDTVQIAFNSNFQAFVQPALGLLMIASVASSVVGEEDENNIQ
ncbi:hypothetical protein MPSEU_000931000 [Mayamaea pseudoterrestris]|nr:hypothetical protein MPSEU_000931000 [Mayamaea pseudoterrestris]